MVERIYLDTNVYCRPLDDQSDSRIREESIAFLEILNLVHNGEIQIVTSDYVKFETEQILDPSKRKDVRGFERALSSVNVSSGRRAVTLALRFSSECNIGSLDALHISAACHGYAAFLLTCDDEILNKTVCIERLAAEKGYRLRVRNPMNYLRERWRIKKWQLRG